MEVFTLTRVCDAVSAMFDFRTAIKTIGKNVFVTDNKVNTFRVKRVIYQMKKDICIVSTSDVITVFRQLEVFCEE